MPGERRWNADQDRVRIGEEREIGGRLEFALHRLSDHR